MVDELPQNSAPEENHFTVENGKILQSLRQELSEGIKKHSSGAFWNTFMTFCTILVCLILFAGANWFTQYAVETIFMTDAERKAESTRSPPPQHRLRP